MKRYTLLILTVLMLAPLLPFAESTNELKEIDEPLLSSGLASPIISNNAWANAISLGGQHSCAIESHGAIYCWGQGSSKQLGNGGSNEMWTPTLTSSLGTGRTAVAISSGNAHTCAILDNGAVSCWGDSSSSQLGYGGNIEKTIPTLTYSLGANRTAVAISSGDEHTCVILDNGDVSCWGSGYYGQLGNGGTSTRHIPTLTSSLGANRTAVAISSGSTHTCVILDNGAVSCWGEGPKGQLGHGTAQSKTTPTLTSSLGTGRTAIALSTGSFHTCAILDNGNVSCWGYGAYGQLGNGDTNNRITPTLTSSLGTGRTAVALFSAGFQTCAILDNGAVSCWGYNGNGQLGNGDINTNIVNTPTLTSSLGANRTAVAISLGSSHTCAILDNGAVSCWGEGTNGRLGSGDNYDKTIPPIRFENTTIFGQSIITAVEGQPMNYSIRGSVFDNINYSQVNFLVQTPPGVVFNVDNHTLTGTPTYTTQTQWLFTIINGTQNQTTTYTLQILADTDGDGEPNTLDTDDDGDGFGDPTDACPTQYGNSTIDQLGCPDSDGDGYSNIGDAFANDATQFTDADQDGFGDNASGNLPDGCPAIYGDSARGNLLGCPDADGDRWADLIDVFVNDLSQWNDSDSDGFGDSLIGFQGDACPTTVGNSTADRYGCPDADGDGWSDDGDDLPQNPTQWIDRDGDGYGDNQSETATMTDIFSADGTQWIDSDGDGYGDNPSGNNPDAFPNDDSEWQDTDGDDVGNNADAFPFDPSQQNDSDGDGFGDNERGSGADKFPNDSTQWSDIDGDGYGDNADGTNPDAFIADPTQWADADGDGYGDSPTGRQADAFVNDATQWLDQDGDGLGDNLSGNNPDPYLFDFDNDGYNDSIDPLPKLASPGDLDNDGTPDVDDLFPEDFREWADADGDGEGDNADPDDDNDGWADTDELREGTDPFSSSSQPVNSFEIVLPGTTIGLGAWDLIGMFGGIPLFCWIAFGFVTRNGRTAKFETRLREANTRDELEGVARQWEYSLMLRLLGPHQGIRLERLRAELDDRYEAQNQRLSSIEPEPHDQTEMVEEAMNADEKLIPAIQPDKPAANLSGVSDGKGYEWITQDNGVAWFRIENSDSEWELFEA